MATMKTGRPAAFQQSYSGVRQESSLIDKCLIPLIDSENQ